MKCEEAIKKLYELQFYCASEADSGENGCGVWQNDVDALYMAISALREQEERSKACPYCDVAKANEGVKNTVLWVKEPETNKWTMMGKKLLFCPMCGRRLEEV